MSPVGRWCAGGAVLLGALTFATWNLGGGPPAAGRPLDGGQLFRTRGCASCHDGPASTAAVPGFPTLADAPSWAGHRRPGMAAEVYLAESIRTPTAFISPAWRGGTGPTTVMPQLGLTEDEIDALVAFLLDPV